MGVEGLSAAAALKRRAAYGVQLAEGLQDRTQPGLGDALHGFAGRQPQKLARAFLGPEMLLAEHRQGKTATRHGR